MPSSCSIRLQAHQHWAHGLTTAAVALASAITIPSAMAQDNTQTLKADLQIVANQRIFFGHQSVGDNLLDGLRQLAKDAQVPLNIVEVGTVSALPASTLGHAHVAENTQPLKKLASFEHAMGKQPAGLNIALLKFCYVDIHPGTDVTQLFNAYQQTVNRVKTAHPGTRILHVTAPLTTIQTGWKVTVKSWLGKTPYGVQENLKREAYNQLLRQAYGQKEPLFDLARVETQLPNGQTHQFTWKDQVVPALVPAYSDDGEHLNAVGQQHAARALVAALVKASARP